MYKYLDAWKNKDFVYSRHLYVHPLFGKLKCLGPLEVSTRSTEVPSS